jgi:hypothetical protein
MDDRLQKALVKAPKLAKTIEGDVVQELGWLINLVTMETSGTLPEKIRAQNESILPAIKEISSRLSASQKLQLCKTAPARLPLNQVLRSAVATVNRPKSYYIVSSSALYEAASQVQHLVELAPAGSELQKRLKTQGNNLINLCK